MLRKNPIKFLFFRADYSPIKFLCTIAARESTPTKTWNRSSTQNQKESIDFSPLYHKLSKLNSTKGSVAEVMNQWIGNHQRKPLNRFEISGFVEQLRKLKHFKTAIQLLEWMETRGMHLSYGDHAKRIDLLWKIEGIVAAEKYFMEIPKPAKNKFTYGSLLNCFCNEKLKEKATKLLQEMKTLNIESNAFAYNSLIVLHMKLDEPEKVSALEQEMRVRKIAPNIFTYNLLMSSYGSLEDIEGVERIHKEVEGTSEIKPDWSFYCNLAGIYVRAGLFEKADSVLKDIERKKMLREREAFHFLLSLYANMGNRIEVNRIWESLKSLYPKITNASYLTMLQTLTRLNDLDGVKKCFDEWESVQDGYDIRMINAVIIAYLRHNMIEEAKSLLAHGSQRYKPNFSTHVLFVDFYLENHVMDSALKHMEVVSLNLKKKETPIYRERANILLKYFEEEKDVEGAKKFCNVLKVANCLDQDVHNFMLQIYNPAEKTEPHIHQGVEVDAAKSEKRVESVCTE